MAKYISIDIETSGLDSEKDMILEFGAILEDTNNPLSYEESPKFHRYIKHDRYEGCAYALALNQRIFKILAYDDDPDIITLERLAVQFHGWLYNNEFKYDETINVAGKNFQNFDSKFLSKIYNWNKLIKIHRRVLDPAILFWNPLTDTELPSQDECLIKANISGKVNHTALGDAWQVIQLLRTTY